MIHSFTFSHAFIPMTLNTYKTCFNVFGHTCPVGNKYVYVPAIIDFTIAKNVSC